MTSTTHSNRSRTLTVTVALVSTLAITQNAAGTTWVHQELLPDRAADAAAAASPDGTAIVISWDPSGLQAWVRPPGGRFGTPVRLVDQQVAAADVATGANGTTAVMWALGSQVSVAVRRSGGTFSQPVTVGFQDQRITGRTSDVEVGADGTIHMAWVGGSNEQRRIFYSNVTPGGVPSPPRGVSSSGPGFGDPAMVVAPNGDVTFAWRHETGQAGAPMYVRTRKRTFDAPVKITDQACDAPALAVAPTGRVTVVWCELSGGKSVVKLSTRPEGGAFGRSVGLSANTQWGLRPTVALTRAGDAYVAWSQSTDTQDQYLLRMHYRNAATGRGTTWSFAGVSTKESVPSVGIANNGSVHLVWRNQYGNSVGVIHKARGEDRLTGPLMLPGSPFAFPVAVNPGGGAVIPRQGTSTSVSWSLIRPWARARPRVSGTARVGSVVTCRHDLWTEAVTTRAHWTRNGRRIALGRTLRLRSADRGARIACVVRATNPTGSRSIASYARTIS